MSRIYLTILFLSFIILPGCKDDSDNITSNHFSNELLGSWELISGDSGAWKYLTFNTENYFYLFLNYSDDRHDLYFGVYLITENQIDLGNGLGGLYIFDVRNDTLTLTTPSNTLAFVKNNSVPDKDEWVIPMKVLREFNLTHLTGMYNLRDIAFDGSHFWITEFHSGIIKIDSLGNVLTSYPIYNSGGIAYGNGRLWVSSRDTIKQINPLNGEILSTKKIAINFLSMNSLGFENGYIWASDFGKVYKIDQGSGEMIQSFEFYDVYGVEFQGEKLWTVSNAYAYSIDTVTGKATHTYDPQGYGFSMTGLASDGNNLWTIFYDAVSGSFSLLKLDIP